MIVTPVYRPDLSDIETELATITGRVTDLPRVFVVPLGMDAGFLKERFPESALVSTDPSNMASVHAYNQWLTSRSFYELWSDFRWSLICQLDAVLVADPWTIIGADEPDWDYLGAPWSPAMRVVTRGSRILVRSPSGADRGPTWVGLVGRRLTVGNGGLSLRCRDAFSSAAHQLEAMIPVETRQRTHEDVLWSAFGPQHGIRIAHHIEAAKVFWETIDPSALTSAAIPPVAGYHGVDKWPEATRSQFINEIQELQRRGQGRFT